MITVLFIYLFIYKLLVSVGTRETTFLFNLTYICSRELFPTRLLESEKCFPRSAAPQLAGHMALLQRLKGGNILSLR